MEPTGREVGWRVRGGASRVQRNDGGAVAVRRGSPKVSQRFGECTFVHVPTPEPTCLCVCVGGQKQLNNMFWTLVSILRK